MDKFFLKKNFIYCIYKYINVHKLLMITRMSVEKKFVVIQK